MTLSGTRALLGSTFEVGIFSTVTNLLLLVSPLYMLQIYDRVLPAASMPTLLYLSLIALGALVVLGLLEIVRAYYANRVASRLDKKLGSIAFMSALTGPRAGLGDVQPLRDLQTLRTFISSRVLFFVFDLPFGPLFIALLYLIHPLLFLTTALGALIMIGIALLNQYASKAKDKEAAEAGSAALQSAQAFARNAETVRALGMTGSAVEFWGDRFMKSIQAADKVASVNAFYGGLSRTIRMGLQLIILGVGAYLVLEQQITAGMIFASSIIAGRALQPLDQIVGSWRQIMEAGRAWKRLTGLAEATQAVDQQSDIQLPEPKGALNVDQAIYFVPNADQGAPPLIKRVSFVVEPGETVAMIGPSQAGKSTLARLIVGAIKPRSGVIRIDGADIQNWDPDELGKHIGYLSQEVELFPGTIAQNISRFAADAKDEEIIEAAKQAHIHELVLGQKNGYATVIGPAGVRLSGGERQRIGLSRALYGNPKLVVLDEPNANLDAEGEAALERSIIEAKARKTTVLIITHRPSIAAKCDRVMMLRDGQIELYGAAQDVLQRLQQGAAAGKAPAPPAGAPAAPSAVVGVPATIKQPAAANQPAGPTAVVVAHPQVATNGASNGPAQPPVSAPAPAAQPSGGTQGSASASFGTSIRAAKIEPRPVEN